MSNIPTVTVPNLTPRLYHTGPRGAQQRASFRVVDLDLAGLMLRCHGDDTWVRRNFDAPQNHFAEVVHAEALEQIGRAHAINHANLTNTYREMVRIAHIVGAKPKF